MAFPNTVLSRKVELFIDNAWVDVTADTRWDFTVRRGQSSEGGEVDPGSCEITFDNANGKYSPRNPNSIYYGKLGRNTIVRVSVNEGTSYLNIADTVGDRASTPDNAALDVTGDLDLRVEVRPDSVFTTDDQMLIGKYDTGTNNRAYRLLVAGSDLYLTWSTNGTDFIQKQSTSAIQWSPSRKIALRATLDVNDGAGNNVARFYQAETMAGPWRQIGDPVTTAGVTSIFASTAPLDVGAIQTLGFRAPQGEIFKAEVRNGINGTVVANPDFTAQAVGATSFTDGAGRVWTLAGDATIANKRQRFLGEISEWPAEWTEGGKDVWTTVTASGILRRLKQSSSPLESTLKRSIAAAGPLGYWPMEDNEGATLAASGLVNGSPLKTTGLNFGAQTDLPSSRQLPSTDGAATAFGEITPAFNDGWHTEMVYRLTSLPTTSQTLLRQNIHRGPLTINHWRVRASSTAITVDVRNYDDVIAATTSTSDPDAIADFFGEDWRRLQFFSFESGGNLYATARWKRIAPGAGWWTLQLSILDSPVGRPSAPTLYWHNDLSGMDIGHISVWDVGGATSTTPGVTAYDSADIGYAGETAINRLIRISDEEGSGTLFQVFDGDVNADSEQVGPKTPDPFLEAVESTAAVDDGILRERREGQIPRLEYRDRAGLYDQTPVHTINYTGDDGLVLPLQPVDDDQMIKNDVTVTREDGSSYRQVQTTGQLNVNNPDTDVTGVGRYQDDMTLNLYSDLTQPRFRAGWEVRKGTVDEARFPTVRLLLHAAPTTITAAALVDIGDRIQITNTPSWLPPGPIDLIVRGYEERLSQYEWELEYACVPATPWSIAEVANTYEPDVHVDTDGSQLIAAATSTATTLEVKTTSGKYWITGSMTLTGASATASADSTVTNTFLTPDADAADIAVGNTARLFDSSGNLREETVFTVDSKVAAAGTTTITFSPSAAERTNNGEQMKVVTSTGAFPTDFPFDCRVGGEVVNVTGISSSVLDTFTRTTSSSWGTSDSGDAWTNTGGAASDYSTNGTTGRHSHSATNTPHNSTIAQIGADSDLVASFAFDALATGASVFGFVLARWTDTSNTYYARLEFTTAQAVILSIRKRVAGVDTQIGTAYTTGLTHSAATLFRVRFQVSGSTLRARAWVASGVEPTRWHVDTTDTQFTAAASLGVRTHIGTGNTNALPRVFTIDNFEVLNPQSFTVTRSANGIIKAQSSGADIRLANPAYVGL